MLSGTATIHFFFAVLFGEKADICLRLIWFAEIIAYIVNRSMRGLYDEVRNVRGFSIRRFVDNSFEVIFV